MSTTLRDRTVLRRDHRARSSVEDLCVLCAETFPCTTIRLLDEVEALEERIDETARVILAHLRALRP